MCLHLLHLRLRPRFGAYFQRDCCHAKMCDKLTFSADWEGKARVP